MYRHVEKVSLCENVKNVASFTFPRNIWKILITGYFHIERPKVGPVHDGVDGPVSLAVTDTNNKLLAGSKLGPCICQERQDLSCCLYASTSSLHCSHKSEQALGKETRAFESNRQQGNSHQRGRASGFSPLPSPPPSYFARVCAHVCCYTQERAERPSGGQPPPL